MIGKQKIQPSSDDLNKMQNLRIHYSKCWKYNPKLFNIQITRKIGPAFQGKNNQHIKSRWHRCWNEDFKVAILTLPHEVNMNTLQKNGNIDILNREIETIRFKNKTKQNQNGKMSPIEF